MEFLRAKCSDTSKVYATVVVVTIISNLSIIIIFVINIISINLSIYVQYNCFNKKRATLLNFNIFPPINDFSDVFSLIKLPYKIN